MKKAILALSIAALAANVYAFDSEAAIKTKGTVGSYTKTEYSVTQKFGDYYRSPKAKFTHNFASNGKETDSTELTSRDSVVDTVSYAYTADGKLASKICTDADGKVQWKFTYAYDATGNIIDESAFNASDVLTDRTIWKYNGKQVDESYYNADGTLLGKIITKKDDSGRVVEVAKYDGSGWLEVKQVHTYNDAGKLSEIAYLDYAGNQIKRIVYRFDSSYSITEKQTYNMENKLHLREIYKYDSTGNVTKATTYEVAEKFGTTVNELVAINEYAYKYGVGTGNLKTVADNKAEAPAGNAESTVDAK